MVWTERWTAAVLGLLLLTGCGPNGNASSGESSPPTATTPATSGTATDAMFAFAPPDPSCPAPSTLETLSNVDDHRYRLDSEVLFSEIFNRSRTTCDYLRAGTRLPPDEIILERHVVIESLAVLYMNESELKDQLTGINALPLDSSAVDDWREVMRAREGIPLVWTDDCGEEPRDLCQGENEATVKNYRWRTQLVGHVGNLAIHMDLYYISKEMPWNAEPTTIAIARELAQAIIDTYQPAG